jgi:aryl-alcohol dehydrogenase-like predicted oxidoreductase
MLRRNARLRKGTHLQYTTLGKTGLKVSVAGLGCGGNSQVGLGTGLSTAQSVALVREAINLGISFVDTAEAYGTEHIVGEAIAGLDRDSVVISTKCRITEGGAPRSGAQAVASLEASLRKLRTDHVDVFLLHGVPPQAYARVREQIAPALLRAKEKGKIRHLGLSESSPLDPEHDMLQSALADPAWEVVMFAFHMLNQAARTKVFPQTQARGVGTLLMFVVRNIFSRPGLLAETMSNLVAEGKVPKEFVGKDSPLDFLVHPGGAASIVDAAYRFARHEAGSQVVLFGTGSREHLRSNIDSILRPPLPAADVEKLHSCFDTLRGVGLDLPDRAARR